jgi:hypothetical protein
VGLTVTHISQNLPHSYLTQSPELGWEWGVRENAARLNLIDQVSKRGNHKGKGFQKCQVGECAEEVLFNNIQIKYISQPIKEYIVYVLTRCPEP